MVESWADHLTFVVMMREELKTRLLVFVSTQVPRKICVEGLHKEAEVKEANLK